MNNGNVNNNNKTNNNYVWPVRGGEWSARSRGSAPPHFSFESLWACYRRCRIHKRGTLNALRFEMDAEANLFSLAEALSGGTYTSRRSVCFVVDKPKMREIVAADFRDRVVHHLLTERLEAVFEPIFIHDTYACRKGKGLHKAVARVREFIRKGSQNETRRLFCLHLDISNFFMSIDQSILFDLLRNRVTDEIMLDLAKTVISCEPGRHCVVKGSQALLEKVPRHKRLCCRPPNKGLPVGNLTSQFFANVYLNELDQFVKHRLKCRFYLRYCDDFLLLADSVSFLESAREAIRGFLDTRLQLTLNERYARITPVTSGIDFLGYIIRPGYVLVRRRVVNNLRTRLETFEKQLVRVQAGCRHVFYHYPTLERLRSVLASYLGHFKWADTYRLRQSIWDRFAFLREFFHIAEEGLMPLYRFRQDFRCVRSQYLYYAARFYGTAVFMQVGRFYEFYGAAATILHLLGLKPLAPNRRGATHGFALAMGTRYAKTALAAGYPVVFVRQTGHYFGTVQLRLPQVKVSAA